MSPRKLTYLLGPPAVAEASQRGRRRGQLPLVGRRPTTFTRYTYTARLSRAPFDRSSPSSFELHPETTPSRNDIDERTSSRERNPCLSSAKQGEGGSRRRERNTEGGEGGVSVQLQKSEARTAARPRRECSRYLGLGGPKGRGMRGEGKPPAGFQG